MFRWISSLFKSSEEGQETARDQSPYAAVKVGFDRERAWCHWPGKKSQSIRWDRLIGVAVETTDGGPFAEDVWWHLAADEGVITYPSEASGSDALLSRLQEIPSFNNERLIQAMTSTDNQTFILWDSAGRHL